MELITYDDFAKLDIRIGTITLAERIEGADKLLRLEVDLGNETRQLAAGVAQWYEPEQLVGKQVPIIVNLEPRTIRGVESHGMMLAAGGDQAYLLHPDQPLEPGTEVH